jgi:hypothetical protein
MQVLFFINETEAIPLAGLGRQSKKGLGHALHPSPPGTPRRIAIMAWRYDLRQPGGQAHLAGLGAGGGGDAPHKQAEPSVVWFSDHNTLCWRFKTNQPGNLFTTVTGCKTVRLILDT